MIPALLQDMGELPPNTVRPCPFCGCLRVGAVQYNSPPDKSVWVVFCGEGTCSARVLADTKDGAIAKWQRKPEATNPDS